LEKTLESCLRDLAASKHNSTVELHVVFPNFMVLRRDAGEGSSFFAYDHTLVLLLSIGDDDQRGYEPTRNIFML
jgi:hypothetical protein